MICGFVLFGFSVVHGTMGGMDFHRYLTYLAEQRGDELPEVYAMQLKGWYKWAYFHYVLVALVAVITLFFAIYIAVDWTSSR